MKKIKFLDKEEKTLMNSLEKGEWVSDFNNRIKFKYEKYAKYNLEQQKKINI